MTAHEKKTLKQQSSSHWNPGLKNISVLLPLRLWKVLGMQQDVATKNGISLHRTVVGVAHGGFSKGDI